MEIKKKILCGKTSKVLIALCSVHKYILWLSIRQPLLHLSGRNSLILCPQGPLALPSRMFLLPSNLQGHKWPLESVPFLKSGQLSHFSSCYYGLRALGIVLESYSCFSLGLGFLFVFCFLLLFGKTVP